MTSDRPPWKESATTKRLKQQAEHLNETLDDSMGSDFRVFKAVGQAQRSENLDRAVEFDDGGWTKHTEYHWQRHTSAGLLNFWPSRWKAQLHGKMVYGEARVRDVFKQLGINQD